MCQNVCTGHRQQGETSHGMYLDLIMMLEQEEYFKDLHKLKSLGKFNCANSGLGNMLLP